MTIPIALIVDDAAPTNPAYWLHPDAKHTFVIPNSFPNDFAEVCLRYGVKGKFSVLPMPSGLGRIDEKLNYVPQSHVRQFLRIVRERIVPNFDITPELLTHQFAYKLDGSGFHHLCEDEWVDRATVDEITDYLCLALRILKNVGLNARGVTSPWYAGINNEKRYAEAIGRAQWRVFRRKFSWYFLHSLSPSNARWPWISWFDPDLGLRVISVPGTTDDYFWGTQRQENLRAMRAVADRGADMLLTADGKQGEIRQLFDQGYPICIVTHWQSLFSQGRAAGLRGLEKVFQRVENVFGDDVQWTTFSDLARLAITRSEKKK